MGSSLHRRQFTLQHHDILQNNVLQGCCRHDKPSWYVQMVQNPGHGRKKLQTSPTPSREATGTSATSCVLSVRRQLVLTVNGRASTSHIMHSQRDGCACRYWLALLTNPVTSEEFYTIWYDQKMRNLSTVFSQSSQPQAISVTCVLSTWPRSFYSFTNSATLHFSDLSINAFSVRHKHPVTNSCCHDGCMVSNTLGIIHVSYQHQLSTVQLQN